MVFYHQHPSLSRQRFFQDCPIRNSKAGISWLRWDGEPLNQQDWQNAWTKCLGLLLDSDHFCEVDEKGQLLRDDSILLLFSAVDSDLPFHLPEPAAEHAWELVLDTRFPRFLEPRPRQPARTIYPLQSRSVAVFRQVKK